MLQSIVLKPGEKALIPSGAQIISITETGGGVALSQCKTAAQKPMKCYFLRWEGFDTEADTSPDTLESLQIGDIVIDFEAVGRTSATELKDMMDNQASFVGLAKAFCAEDAGDKHNIWIAAVDKVELKVLNKLSTDGTNPPFPFYVKGVEDNTCTNCNNYISNLPLLTPEEEFKNQVLGT